MMIKYKDINGNEQTESQMVPIADGDIMQRARMQIQTDGKVQFYLDDVLIYTSANPLNPDYSEQATVGLGSRGISVYDNVIASTELPKELCYPEDGEFDLSDQNYGINIFNDFQSLQAKMETEYTAKPFYSPDSMLSDLQTALDIAIDKAKRTTGFGIDKITVGVEPKTNKIILQADGQNGPFIKISERDLQGDGKADSATANNLGLLKELGAIGSGTDTIHGSEIKVSATIAYLLDTINNPENGSDLTASIGNNGRGATIDISSNINSSYIKVRDTLSGNTASQIGITTTRSIFQTMIDFRDGLYRNDPDYVATEVLQRLEQDENRVLEYRAQVGSIVNRLDQNTEKLESARIQHTSQYSSHQDLDLADAVIELRALEFTQQAALNVGSKILNQSLLEFLG
jgi:flagellin-like hook-associated protein FlgL